MISNFQPRGGSWSLVDEVQDMDLNIHEPLMVRLAKMASFLVNVML
jgi:hypothetical protein